ncbi:B- and T-lymphocyte attenuator-like [Pygocentrus nattereri]|uniref:Ig-like domain-containing protein n=1 Tax=Pygocentrus nattereri TaxID=42514 RepID=A0A3B4EBA6_PYGNA|nr:B- and T-lymphocyte attenuator-like [Pygocentrus nattereri]
MMDKPFLDMTSVLNGVLLALILLGSVDAQGSTGLCVPAVRVRKSTVYRGSSKSPLRVPCPVSYCEQIPTVRWSRLDDSDQWIPVSETDQVTVTQDHPTAGEKEIISYLSFKNVSVQDGGIYRCVAAGSNSTSQSHNINVSISDTNLDTVNGINSTSATEKKGTMFTWVPYIMICSGILGLFTLVMLISFLSLHGSICSRKAKKQRTQVPPCPNILKYNGHVHSQEKPEQRKKVFDTSKETLEPDMPSQHPVMDQKSTLSRSSGEQGPQQIVYATLEHLTPRETSLISLPSREQLSEYASIRIC